MKFVPFIRFSWAIYIIYNYLIRTDFNFNFSHGIEILEVIITGLLTLSFAAYCIIIGLQEIRDDIIIEAKYFESFGIIFEFGIFIGGLFLIGR